MDAPEPKAEVTPALGGVPRSIEERAQAWLEKPWQSDEHALIRDLLAALLRVRTQQEPEICICAAVHAVVERLNGEREQLVIRGHRHPDCFHNLSMRPSVSKLLTHTQGFITSQNRFVDRKEGARLMRAVEWHNPETGLFFVGDILLSEDLY